ncbi:Galactose oxidase protein [Dioscorea alata]|uniref:Galactose oxidase protein n=1 Tax=Dioscorea alata TaxID=55571 RepID=A0ACB7VC42_DIOAL|nr:Galactose oxidase protein [Dioscorea alata]
MATTISLPLLLIFLSTFPSVSYSQYPPIIAGNWKLLQSSIGISAMHMQVLPGDKLLAFDRTDFGPSNISLPAGHCRQDPSDLALPTDCTAHSILLDLPSLSLRPLSILTDTWCSSGSLLPNSSFFQSGGFNDGDHTIRLFTSDSDWSETSAYLSARRWYSTNQLLPDGRVIIIGGRRQFNYEFFPKDHIRPLTSFPFLDETRDGDAENNLYPFVHLLPDGTLFVFANTRAVLLDLSHNGYPLRHLPAIPDAVPRNYPSSGSSVLLPLRPPSHSPEILICGGAPRGSFQAALNGTFYPAARTCGRIYPLDQNPTWAMEDMPTARVMGDMVVLPTGDVLLVNGAAAGTAGWELARDPVTVPVLYNPNKPAGNRFGLMNRSPIPRLYHSSAVLDTYGRVLVGGSNPHVCYNFTNVMFPTELSLEAFHPPYLSASLDGLRPEVVAVWAGERGGGAGEVPATVVGYGEEMGVRFTVKERKVGGEVVEVVVVVPAFGTHSFGMNQRVVVLEGGRDEQVAPYVYELMVKAPPSPEVAPPGYYMMFVVHAGVPGRGLWVKIQRRDVVT